MEEGYQEINPRRRAKNRRLLEECMEFLKGEESSKNPEGTMKTLFALYEGIDPRADYIKPGERQFFPENKRQRTLQRFLEGFRYIYFILKRAQERIYLGNAFDNFWEQCKAYLYRCNYSESFVDTVCTKDSLFYRQSFNFWRSEFDDSEEGFSIMYEYFKACFGIKGNDEYCCISSNPEITYDWRRMRSSYEKFHEKPRYLNPSLEPPNYVPPSAEKLKMLRELIMRNKRGEKRDFVSADTLLKQIRERNREKGYFQNA